MNIKTNQKLSIKKSGQHSKYKIGKEAKFIDKLKAEIADKIREFIKKNKDILYDFYYPKTGNDSKAFKNDNVIVLKVTNKKSIKALFNFLKKYFECSLSGNDFKVINQKYKFYIKFSSGKGFFFEDEGTLSAPSTKEQELGTIFALKYYIKNKTFAESKLINSEIGFTFDNNWQNNFINHVTAINSFIKLDNSYEIELDSAANKIGDKIFKLLKKLGFKESKDNWNPADIWIYKTSKKSFIMTSLAKAESVNEFNQLIKKYFNAKILLGVSLKKMIKLKNAVIIDSASNNDFKLKFAKSSMSLLNTYYDIKTTGFPKDFLIRARAKAKTISKETDIRIYFEGKKSNSTEFLGAIPKTKFSSLLPKSDTAPKIVNYEILKKLINDVKIKKYMTIKDIDKLDFSNELNIKYLYVLIRYLKYIYSMPDDFITDLGLAGYKMNKFSSIHLKVGG